MSTAESPVAPGDLVAAIDAGSNAIRFGIYKLSRNFQPLPILQKRYPVCLGAGVFASGAIAENDIQSAAAAFQEMAESSQTRNCKAVVAVATSAIREATNQAEFVQRVKETSGIELKVISGDDEAGLVAMGVDIPPSVKRDRLIVDIGGGSTEIIYSCYRTQQFFHGSLPLGAVRLAEEFGRPAAYEKEEISKLRKRILDVIEEHIPQDYLNGDFYAVFIGGAARALAQCAYEFDMEADHNHLSISSAVELGDKIAFARVADLPALFGIEASRAQIMIPGAMIVIGVMLSFTLPEIRISNSGIREGLVRQYVLLHQG